MPYVALNDRILPAADARLPVAAEGVRFGSGCFETIAVAGAAPRFWERHMERFFSACGKLGIAPKVSAAQLRSLAQELIDRKGLTAGVLRLSSHQDGTAADTVLAFSPPRYVVPPQSLRLALSPFTHQGCNPLSGIKHNNYSFFLAAHAQAAARGFDEAVLADTDGNLLEGSRTNLFILTEREQADAPTAPNKPHSQPSAGLVKSEMPASVPAKNERPANWLIGTAPLNKRPANWLIRTAPLNKRPANWLIRTAPLSSGVLPGIMRSLVADVADGCGCVFLEAPFTLCDAKAAAACFVSNALLGVVPVAELDGHSFGPASEAASVVHLLDRAIRARVA